MRIIPLSRRRGGYDGYGWKCYSRLQLRRFWKREGYTTDTNPFRYSGEYFDSETGNIYLRARYYDPATSRMLSEDTYWNTNNMIYGDKEYKDGEIKVPDINAIMQSSNLYVYVLNNPIRYTDPTGLRTYVLNGINNGKAEGVPEDIEKFGQELRDRGVEDVRTVGVYNGTGIFSGAGQAIMEMLNNGQYADAVAQQILNDLANDPLADGEQLNIIGYSGGGQIALNVDEKLSGKATISNTLLIGAPVMEATLNNTGTTVMMFAAYDPLWSVHFWKYEFTGWYGHTGYFTDKNIDNVANIADKYIN